jgi:hypothetical protein
VLTTDNMEKKNWSLCFCQPETTGYILTQCNYTEALHQIAQQEGPVQWVRFLSSRGFKEEQRYELGILFTFWWMI